MDSSHRAHRPNNSNLGSFAAHKDNGDMTNKTDNPAGHHKGRRGTTTKPKEDDLDLDFAKIKL